MALSDDNQRWILEQIDLAVHPNGWKRVADWLRYWGVLAILVTAFLALIGIATTLGVLAANLISQNSEFRGKTDARLTSIETDLKEIKAQVTKQNLAAHAGLPLSDFKATLPDLSASIVTARSQDLKVPTRIVDDLSRKMTAIEKDTPQFWPVGAELISYRSFTTSSPLQETLPKCTDSLPTIARINDQAAGNTLNTPNQTLKFNPGVYENCRFTLDSDEEDNRINDILNGGTPALLFRRCQIVYNGGPINLILAFHNKPFLAAKADSERHMTSTAVPSHVTVPHTLSFEDYLFTFSVQGVPPPTGQQVIETLLAQNGRRLKLPTP